MSNCRLIGIVSLLFLICAASFGSTASVKAQASDPIVMTITPSFGGRVKHGEWLGLRVSLENSGNDANVDIQAEVADQLYSRAVALPAGARKDVHLYVLPYDDQPISVRLVQGEQSLVEAQVHVSLYPQAEYLIATTAPDPDALIPLSGLSLPGRGQAHFISLTLQDLPERVEPLRSLDCLILAGDTSSLTVAQGEALRAWVEAGGRLLIGGGTAAHRTMVGLPESLRPVTLDETAEPPALGTLADFVNEPILVPGPFLVTWPAEHQGLDIINQDGRALLVQQPMGQGWVSYLALDPAASPFDAWTGTLPFWTKLLESNSILIDDTPAHIQEAAQMNNPLRDMPALDLPSINSLALLLGLYILIVGPVNYLLLRRLRLLAWAWVTIPILTLAFSIGGFRLGYALRGADVIVKQISVLPLSPGASHLPARTYIGLFSPSSTTYDVQVGGNALVSRLSPEGGSLNVIQEKTALVQDLSVGQWTMEGLQAQTWTDDETLNLDATLSFKDGQVQGTIRNNLERPLRDAILLAGSRYARLGDLDAGKETTVEAVLQSADNPFSSASPQETQLLLNAYFDILQKASFSSADTTLLAWTDLNPIEVQVKGTQGVKTTWQRTTLVVARLPLSPVDGQIEFPLGSIRGRPIELAGYIRKCAGPGTIQVNDGYVVLEYPLPLARRTWQPTALTISVNSTEQGSPVPTLLVYNWTDGIWMTLGNVDSGPVYSIDNPGNFVSPISSTIRLQVQDSGGSACHRLDVGLKGLTSTEGESQ
jgi:hypothetical protein